MLEKDFQKKAMRFLKTVKSLIVIKKDQGKFSNHSGISDLIICYQGQAIFIELKVNNNKMTPLQLLFQEEARKAGAIAEEAQSIADVKKILKIAEERIKLKKG